MENTKTTENTETSKPPKFIGPGTFLSSINVDYVTWLEHRVKTFETIMKERDDLKQQAELYGGIVNESRWIIFSHEGHVMDGDDVPDAIRVLYRRDIQLQGNKAENKQLRKELIQLKAMLT